MPEQPRDAVRYAITAVLATTGVLVGLTLWRTGGVLVYTLDDPAIHLTMARRLAFDGTWGIVAGDYQSASSSPLWVVLLAPMQWLLPGGAGEIAPLGFNLLAASAVVVLLGSDLERIRRAGQRSGALAIAIVAVVLLFLPALALTGMEHIMHMALVLAAARAVERRYCGMDAAGRVWAPLVLLTLATLTRGESAFVAVGLAIAVLALGRMSMRARLVVAAGLGIASACGFVVVAAVNTIFGQSLLPNPVLLKGLGERGGADQSLGGSWDRLWTDPLVGVLLILALAVILLAAVRHDRQPGRDVQFPAIVVAVSITLHVVLATIDGEGRYEAYLLGLGVWMILRLVPAAMELVPRRRWLTAATAVLMLVPLAPLQLRRTATVPDRAEVLYEQRYQVARFLHDAYEHEPIAVGELGYIGLYHDGPLTDVYGIGDHDVLEAWMDDRNDATFWRRLQEERGFKVVAVYNFTLSGQLPDDWITVATWHSPDAYYKVTEFRAAVPEEVDRLRDRLIEYESRLPGDVEVAYNEMAGFAAAAQMDG